MQKEIWVYSNFDIEALKLLSQEIGIYIRSLIEKIYGNCAEIQVIIDFDSEKYKEILFQKFLEEIDYNTDKYDFSNIKPKEIVKQFLWENLSKK